MPFTSRRAMTGASPTFEAYIASLSPLIYFKHDETSGAPVNYGSASGLNITASNITYSQDGKTGTGQAQDFNGTTTIITIANDTAFQAANLDALEDQTWCFLVRPDTTGELNYGQLFAFDTAVALNHGNLGFHNGNVLSSRVNCDTTGGYSHTTTGVTLGEWTWIIKTYSHTGDRKVRIYTAAGGTVTEAQYDNQITSVGNVTPEVDPLFIGTRTSAGLTFDGLFDRTLCFDKVLTQTQLEKLSQYYFNTGVVVSSPAQYEVVQRSGTTGDIAISGTISGSGSYDIEARFNGGSWATIDTNASSTFSGTLSAQTNGQGTLEVRTKPDGVINQVADVGVGDVYVIMGQSNAAGAVNGYQSYSHASLKATLLAKDYNWKNCADPTHSDTGVVDTIMDDPYTVTGSVWPLLATSFMANQSVPIAFIPCAISGSIISQWQPGSDHQDRTTMYGATVYRALQVQNGVKAALWHQGESDVGTAAEATYNASLDTVADAIASDLSCGLVVCKLQDLSTWGVGKDESVINTAIGTAWGDNANVLQGPDFSDITPSVDGLHWRTSAEAQTAADRWWTAIQTLFY